MESAREEGRRTGGVKDGPEVQEQEFKPLRAGKEGLICGHEGSRAKRGAGGRWKIEAELSVNEHSRDGDFRGGSGRLGQVQEREGDAERGRGPGKCDSEESMISVPRFQTVGLQAKSYFALLARKIKSVREFPRSRG